MLGSITTYQSFSNRLVQSGSVKFGFGFGVGSGLGLNLLFRVEVTQALNECWAVCSETCGDSGEGCTTQRYQDKDPANEIPPL